MPLFVKRPPTFEAECFEGGVEDAKRIIKWFDSRCVVALYDPENDLVIAFIYRNDDRHIKIPAGYWIVDTMANNTQRFIRKSPHSMNEDYILESSTR